MDSQETKIFTAVLIASIIIAVIIIYFALSLVRHQRRSLRINRQNVLSEIAALEKDRTRMAADLHDELGPMLSVVKMRINSVDPLREEDKEQLELSSRQIDEVLQRVRGIAKNLMPGTLLRKGLRVALEEFIGSFNQGGTLKVQFLYESRLELDEERSINIYRAVQEVCQNTLKHAKAAQLLIKLYDQKQTLYILCEDNGSGFDYDRMLAENKGLGLRNLRSRIEIMSGRFHVTSRINKGTQYLFEIPIPGTAV